MNILNEIAGRTRERIEEEKKKIPLESLKEQILKREEEDKQEKKTFFQAMKKEGMSYICEIKKASPSKGVLAKDFPYVKIAKEYENAGASAVSCLTEPFYFQGANRYLAKITREIQIPVLRKDFTVDEYMIYQAKALGASAVLLICSILSDGQIKEYLHLTQELGMDALTEIHDEKELERAVNAGAKIIGANNRNLKTFEIDMENSIRLRALTPENLIFVSESGIRTREDIEKLYRNHVDGVLIGESLMKSRNKKETLLELNGGAL